MANRCLLSKNKLEDFKEYLVKKGWRIEETKGTFEVLRAVNKDVRREPLIIYRRDNAKEHYSVCDCDVRIVKAFLKEKP